MGDFDSKVVDVIKRSLDQAVINSLTAYNGPFQKLVASAIERHSGEIAAIVDNGVADLIRSPEFKSSVRLAIANKLASALVAQAGGETEKQINKLKADPGTRDKISAALRQVIADLAKDEG